MIVFILQVAHDHGLARRAAVHARAFRENAVLAAAPWQRNALLRKAAVDLDRLAGDEAGVVGAQEGGHVGNDSGSPRSGHGWRLNCFSYFSGRPR